VTETESPIDSPPAIPPASSADPEFNASSDLSKSKARSVTDPGPESPPVPSRWTKWRLTGVSVAAVVAVAAVSLSYLPELQWMWDVWKTDPSYSHGFFVIPTALVIFWRRRELHTRWSSRPSRLAWVGLVLVLGARAYFYESGNLWTDAITLLPALALLTMTHGGWAGLRRAWPAIAFLIFMFPLPPRINEQLARPLQGLATTGSTLLLGMSGLWVISEGNVLFINDQPLEVAEACNGLSMLLTLAATVSAAVLLVPMSRWKKLVAALSAVPIALACNILRIALTAWCYQLYGSQVGGTYAHTLAGWLMMPTALLFVGLELAILSWMIVEEEIPIGPVMEGQVTLIAPSRDHRSPRRERRRKLSNQPTVLPLRSLKDIDKDKDKQKGKEAP
jgi:exosortase